MFFGLKHQDLKYVSCASYQLRLADGLGSGGASAKFCCAVGEIYGSDIFQRILENILVKIFSLIFLLIKY